MAARSYGESTTAEPVCSGAVLEGMSCSEAGFSLVSVGADSRPVALALAMYSFVACVALLTTGWAVFMTVVYAFSTTGRAAFSASSAIAWSEAKVSAPTSVMVLPVPVVVPAPAESSSPVGSWKLVETKD